MLSKLPGGYRIGGPGAAVVLICFFLPWVLISCGGMTVGSMSGWELAVGTSLGPSSESMMGSMFGSPAGKTSSASRSSDTQAVPGRPVVFLVLVCALGTLALGYLAYQRQTLTMLDGIGLIGLGIVPLFILYTTFGGAQNEAAKVGARVDFELGLWGVIFGYLAVIVGGVQNWMQMGEQAEKAVSATPSSAP